MAVSGLLSRLVSVWRRRLRGAAASALASLFLLALFVAAHIARFGTDSTRLAAGALLVVVVVLTGVLYLRDRRDWSSAQRAIGRVLLPTNRELGERALRALRLLERSEAGAEVGSRTLATAHYERLLQRASFEAVEEAAKSRALGWRYVAVLLLFGALFSFGFGPFRVLEGLAVLGARDGVAPVGLTWLDAVTIRAQPPAYLRRGARMLSPGITTTLPVGTLLTVRGTPRRDGRQLVLTDGEREVLFVSDGRHGVIANWTVETSARLRVAARFGEVLIEDPEALDINALDDRAPEVKLVYRKDDGSEHAAPQRLELEGLDKLDLRYGVSDDHGLRQIDLVLRAGQREDRRVLGRYNGETRSEQGGYVLHARDPFMRRMFLPVVVTIEARDGDPLTTNKRGHSDPIILVPSAVGEPESRRYVALETARGAMVDVLAYRMATQELAKRDPALAARRRAGAKERVERASERMHEVLDARFGGLQVPSGLRAFLLGQLKVLERPTPPGASAVRSAEDVVLAVDVAVRRYGIRDARSVSKRLGDVAEEAADGARQALTSESDRAGRARLDAALVALEAGAGKLRELGPLGKDLGSVAQGDLGRIRRAVEAGSLLEAERAARHLAARLRRPNPSFGSAARGGVESGGGGMPQQEPSQADQRFNQLADELENLAQEHAREIAQVERALAEAERNVDLSKLEDEAKQRAEEIRRALAALPATAGTPGSPRAAGAMAREHASSMAQSISRMSLGDAVESGKNAMAALKDAENRNKRTDRPWEKVDPQVLEDVRKRLEPHLKWAEEALDKLEKAAEAEARKALRESGNREQELARRAGNLSSRGKGGETALPDDAVDALEKAESAMREAVREFQRGNGKAGLERQREAQRLLEQSNTGQTTQSGEEPQAGQSSGNRGDPGGRRINTDGEVPKAEKRNRAEGFRKRVLDGLGREKGGRLSPAVKRYAESLLR